MAINLQYSGDPLLMSEAARLAGQGQFAQAQDQFRAGQDQFHLNLGQRAREFDESTRQFDVTQKEGVRRFDLGYDLNRDQFGEQQRQADIANQRSDFQFGSKLDFDYDQMAQQQYAREQQMAFDAQQQQEKQAAAMAAQQQQQAQARWQTYQGLESQRFEVHTKQGLAELDKLRKHNFRTPELQDAAFAQWEQQYGQYMPAPIDFGPPPEQQDPWDTVPQREFELPDGTKVPMMLRPDGKGGYIPDASYAKIVSDSVKGQADAQNKAAESQKKIEAEEQKKAIKQSEAEFKAKETFQKSYTKAATDLHNNMAEAIAARKKDFIEGKVDAIKATAKAKADAANARLAAGVAPTPIEDVSDAIQKVYDQADADPRLQIPSPEEILESYRTAQGMGQMFMGGAGQGEQSTPTDKFPYLTEEEHAAAPVGTVYRANMAVKGANELSRKQGLLIKLPDTNAWVWNNNFGPLTPDQIAEAVSGAYILMPDGTVRQKP